MSKATTVVIPHAYMDHEVYSVTYGRPFWEEAVDSAAMLQVLSEALIGSKLVANRRKELSILELASGTHSRYEDSIVRYAPNFGLFNPIQFWKTDYVESEEANTLVADLSTTALPDLQADAILAPYHTLSAICDSKFEVSLDLVDRVIQNAIPALAVGGLFLVHTSPEYTRRSHIREVSGKAIEYPVNIPYTSSLFRKYGVADGRMVLRNEYDRRSRCLSGYWKLHLGKTVLSSTHPFCLLFFTAGWLIERMSAYGLTLTAMYGVTDDLVHRPLIEETNPTDATWLVFRRTS